ncbi:DUF6457 domain-containing protein [Leifsonia sp. NPDC014704]|uniref:DUF6457 domain-containing protein n=1 Tax=Leifsonia sp. NPDC014704 TaxID=3364123 RepID=UPI0036F46E0E
MTLREAVIVVAGGRSTRFGSDKLRHRIDGRTLLERTVVAAAGADVVVLVSAADAGDTPDGVHVAVSENPRWGGPCAAIGAGVDALVSGLAAGADDASVDVLIVAADLADPDAALAALREIEAGVLTDEAGGPQWLLARAPLAELARRIADLRRERGMLAGLPAAALLGSIEGRHPAPARIHADIDTPADLPDRADLAERPEQRSSRMEPSELDDWADEAAAAVGVQLEPGDIAAVLDLARDAAHGIARPAAPLTTFIAGIAVGRNQPLAEAVAALNAAIEKRSS